MQKFYKKTKNILHKILVQTHIYVCMFVYKNKNIVHAHTQTEAFGENFTFELDFSM